MGNAQTPSDSSVVLVYDSNNSGGSWWLSDEDWDKLAAAGWNVFWDQADDMLKCIRGEAERKTPSAYSSDPAELLAPVEDKGNRWLDGRAKACAKRVPSAREGIEEWERLTGQDATAIGCNCCGPPHSFRVVKADGEVDYIELEQPTSGRLVFADE